MSDKPDFERTVGQRMAAELGLPPHIAERGLNFAALAHDFVALSAELAQLKQTVGEVAVDMRAKRPSIHCAAADKEWALTRELMTQWADRLTGGSK